jgi:hypothetical protein
VAALEETVVPLRSRGDLVTFTTLLAGAVAVTLLIGCANLASLLLARVDARKRELAIRAALGAGRGPLLRQLFVEAAVVAACGGVGALMVATWIASALAAFELPGGIVVPALRGAFDYRSLVFSAGVSTMTAVLCGLAPAIGGSRCNLIDLKRQDYASSPRLHATGRSWRSRWLSACCSCLQPACSSEVCRPPWRSIPGSTHEVSWSQP